MASVSRLSNYVMNAFGAERYGGQQADFIRRSNENISWIVEQIRTSREDSKGDHKKIFITIVRELGARRHQMARDHKTLDAEEFGRMRGELGEGVCHYTPFCTTLERFNRNLMSRVSSLLKEMQKDGARLEGKTKSFRTSTLGRIEQVTVEVLRGDDLRIMEFMQDDLGKKTIEEWRTLREKEAKRYKDRTLFESIGMILAFFPEKDCGGNVIPAFAKTHFVNVTLRREVERGGKSVLMSLGRRVSWLDLFKCNQRDPVKHLSTLLQHPEKRLIQVPNLRKDITEAILADVIPSSLPIHADRFLIDDWIGVMGGLFEKAILWEPEQGVQELKNTVAELRYLFANVMPFSRGIGAIGEWIEIAIYQSHGFTKVKHKDDNNGDFAALSCLTLAEFLKLYDTLIDLGPKE